MCGWVTAGGTYGISTPPALHIEEGSRYANIKMYLIYNFFKVFTVSE
jgi:hypothetical protein